MNKWLIRNLKPVTRKLSAQGAARLVGMIRERIKGVKTKQEAQEQLTKLMTETVNALTQRGMAPTRIFDRIKIIGEFGLLFIDLTFILLSSVSPAILLLLCLVTTLDNNLVPEWRDFPFEEIKQSLLDRNWPPQRQRCDFVAAPAI